MTDAEPQATDPSVGSAAEELVSRLIARGWTVAVAESLTGGLVVSSLVSVPGASATVRGGVVAYATALKHTLLGVDAALLAAEGAVHPDVARQMAEGVRESGGDRRAGGGRGDRHDGRGRPDTAGRTSRSARSTSRSSTPAGTRVETLALGGTRARIRAEATAAALATRSGVRAADEVVSGGNRPCFVSVTFGDSHPFHSPRD